LNRHLPSNSSSQLLFFFSFFYSESPKRNKVEPSIICPCKSPFPRKARLSVESVIDPKVYSFISHDEWFQKFSPHLSIRFTIPPLIYFPFYPEMMQRLVGSAENVPHYGQNLYTLMRLYELKEYYHNKIYIKDTQTAGLGVYVCPGVTLPKGFVLPFWGVAGHLYNQCIKGFDINRQLIIEGKDLEPTRLIIHPACVAGFVNSSGFFAYKNRLPNCTFEVNEYLPVYDRSSKSFHFVHPSSYAYLVTTKDIVGSATSDDSQLLFQYKSLRAIQIKEKSFKQP